VSPDTEASERRVVREEVREEKAVRSALVEKK
jgi:hypothetical protein